jgi:hypothetical protein
VLAIGAGEDQVVREVTIVAVDKFSWVQILFYINEPCYADLEYIDFASYGVAG